MHYSCQCEMCILPHRGRHSWYLGHKINSKQNNSQSFLYIFLAGKSVLATPLFMLPILYFESCLDLNPESCRSKQVRYLHASPCQLSRPSTFLATHLHLSHRFPYSATHLPTQPPISLLIHPFPYLSTHPAKL